MYFFIVFWLYIYLFPVKCINNKPAKLAARTLIDNNSSCAPNFIIA